MRSPAAIVRWLDRDELERWVHDAPTKEHYRRRLAVWWTACGRLAPDVAALLQTSPRTVRHWIHEFNVRGPTALDSEGWGGRRAAYLSEREERAVLASLRPRARAGRLLTLAEVRTAIQARLGGDVSDEYLYSLLHRHEWRKVVPRPRHVRADPDVVEAFKKTFPRSWRA